MATTPQPRSKFVSIRLTSAEHHAVKVRASRKGITMAKYLQLALGHYHKEGPKK